MTPKPTLSLEDLKNKALAAKALGEEWYSMSGLKILYLVEEDADFITTISPDVVLDLLERLSGMEEALETIGWDAVEASKGAAMAHKAIALSALKLWGTK